MVAMSQIQGRDSIGERLIKEQTSRFQELDRMGEHKVNESARYSQRRGDIGEGIVKQPGAIFEQDLMPFPLHPFRFEGFRWFQLSLLTRSRHQTGSKLLKVDRQCVGSETHKVVKPTFFTIRANILIKQVLHLLYRLRIQGILGSLTFDGVFGDLPDTRFLLLARA